MTRWILIVTCLLIMNIPESIARDPYSPVGYPPCEAGQLGFWNIIEVTLRDGSKAALLVLTSQDFKDPRYVICWVDGKQKVMALSNQPEKQL